MPIKLECKFWVTSRSCVRIVYRSRYLSIPSWFLFRSVEHNPFNNYTSTSNDDFSDQAGTDEWEPPPVEDAGIPVRALYDFQGIEDDELNFKEGDVLTQLSSQDDQGWCQGRFQGKVGHFPGSYVEPL